MHKKYTRLLMTTTKKNKFLGKCYVCNTQYAIHNRCWPVKQKTHGKDRERTVKNARLACVRQKNLSKRRGGIYNLSPPSESNTADQTIALLGSHHFVPISSSPRHQTSQLVTTTMSYRLEQFPMINKSKINHIPSPLPKKMKTYKPP